MHQVPGMKPSRVSPILIRKSTLHPRSASTPKGGRITARITLQISVQVMAMFTVWISLFMENYILLGQNDYLGA